MPTLPAAQTGKEANKKLDRETLVTNTAGTTGTARGSAKPIRVRIAASPTGKCHVGTARTALYNLLFARQHNGSFVLRIDDTDVQRSTLESEQGVLEGLRWLGLEWDEGPDKGGRFGPYRQSERLPIYQRYASELVQRGKAYYCFCSPEDLEKERKAALAGGGMPKYSGRCRELGEQEVETRRRAGERAVVRLRIVPKVMSFTDLVKGRIELDASLMGDPVILKSDGVPTYSYATVVDEHEMQISHVLRGADHTTNTFVQLQAYEALGFDPPEFGHFALLLNPDRSKISKRTGAVFIGEFRDLGYLPEAIVNHLALCGWNPGTEQEVFSFQGLLESFAVEQCSGSNAIFDRSKLLWLNGHYIRHLSIEDLAERALPFLAKAGLASQEAQSQPGLDRLKAILTLERERIRTLDEIPDLVTFFFRDPDPAACLELLKTDRFARKHSLNDVKLALGRSATALKGLPEENWTVSGIKDALDSEAEKLGWKTPELLMPVRIAVSGRQATPPLFETLECVGRSATLRRLEGVTALEAS
jgi:glutamyl-tRNA synthetase